MAQDKKSFILYCDYIRSFTELTDEEAGKLIKHIFQYVNDENPKPIQDRLLSFVFEPIKLQLKRDLKKWEGLRGKRSEAGRNGGLKSGEARASKTKQNEAIASNPKQTQANEAVTATVNVTATEINKKHSFELFWNKYPNKVARSKAQEKFLSLSESEIETILNTIDNFVAYKPFKDYNHPNPTTYLNQKRWQDVLGTPLKDQTITERSVLKINPGPYVR